MPESAADRTWLRPREAADYLGVSLSTLYAWRKKGIVRFYRLGPRAAALRRDELDALAKREDPEPPRLLSAAAVDRLLAGQEAMREKYGIMPDSTPIIRADRDSRGR